MCSARAFDALPAAWYTVAWRSACSLHATILPSFKPPEVASEAQSRVLKAASPGGVASDSSRHARQLAPHTKD